MRTVFLLILLAALLAGCADGENLPQAHGPLFALNPGLGHPTPTELQDPPKVGPR